MTSHKTRDLVSIALLIVGCAATGVAITHECYAFGWWALVIVPATAVVCVFALVRYFVWALDLLETR